MSKYMSRICMNMCMWMDKSVCINVRISLEIPWRRIKIRILKYILLKSGLNSIIEKYWLNQKMTIITYGNFQQNFMNFECYFKGHKLLQWLLCFLTWNQYCYDYYQRVAQAKIFGNFLKVFVIFENV